MLRSTLPDDPGPVELTALQRREVLVILEDHHQRRCTFVASHLHAEHWQNLTVDPSSPADSPHQTRVKPAFPDLRV